MQTSLHFMMTRTCVLHRIVRRCNRIICILSMLDLRKTLSITRPVAKRLRLASVVMTTVVIATPDGGASPALALSRSQFHLCLSVISTL